MAVIDLGNVKGPSGEIAVGTTSTLAAGSNATVTNSGTSTSAVFNFGIPKGEKGDNYTITEDDYEAIAEDVQGPTITFDSATGTLTITNNNA